MADFKVIKKAVQQQFEKMTEGEGELFRVDLTRDYMWDLYLKSFPPGTDPIYRERTEHDCSCCRHFVKDMSNVVAIDGPRMVSIWDVTVPEPYQTVVNAMATAVKNRFVTDVFRYREAHAGTDKNREMSEGLDRVITYDHFYLKIPSRFVSQDPGSELSEMRSGKEVFKRGLEEITMESVEIVLEIIAQNSLYRGQEHEAVVKLLKKHKQEFNSLISLEAKDLYCWVNSVALGGAARFRNTVIGTLLTDLSEGVELTKAVKSFEDKVAPANYKRPSALITKGMIKRAQEKVEELGLTKSLDRRHAVTSDITINNVLFADREARKEMNAFDELAESTAQPMSKAKLDKVEEIGVDAFMSDVLPKADKIELFVENKHSNNFMSLVAPVDPDAKLLFKWDNNFSWAYNGEVTDSIKERVKAAGGNVEGVLRYSLSWFNSDDLDAWCEEPNGNKIGFFYKSGHWSTGCLDVDMNAGGPKSRTPVENITWSNESKMQEGEYRIWVNQYTKRESKDVGFDAELEYRGNILSFHYPKAVPSGQNVVVARFKYTHAGGIEIIESLPSSQASKTVWEIPTQTFRKVSMIMHSPNHWDDRAVGNKHWFFILDGCKNDTPARGFFNEFLKQDLNEHRKVFEVLGSRMKAPESDEQLSGLGFSSTQRNEVLCRVSGSFNRVVKIMF